MQVAVTSVVGSFGAKHRGLYFRLFQDYFGDKQLWDGVSSERSRGNAIIGRPRHRYMQKI